MSTAEDEQLIDLYRETGEIGHFDELARRYVGKVRAMVYPMVLNDADADELTQEVFIRVARAIGAFRREARFSTWLYRIAMNTSHSFIRKRDRNPMGSGETVPDQMDPGADPAGRLAGKEMDHDISGALAGLSAPLRAAIDLVVLQGMSVGDAARIEGCMTVTMYWRVHEARRLLRHKLEQHLRP